MVPAPADAVLVNVGGEADIEYVEVYEPESILNVRDVAVIEKLMFEEVADANVESAAIDALIVHVPAATNATTPEDEPTVQTDVVVLV